MDPTNRNTALASALVEELARCGVRRAVVSPGSRSTPLAVALWREPQIEVSVILDERSAGFFALGSALATGRPAVVLCTSGSAAANLHPSIVEADEAGVPMLVVTADRPPELREIGAGQTIDQLKLYGDAVRWFCEVGTHEADDDGLLHFRSVACRGHACAVGDPRPGPVHLNVPWREPLAPTPAEGQVSATDPLALEGRGDEPLHAVTAGSPRADEALLDELAERIEGEPRALIVAGRQGDAALAGPVAQLAAAAGYPILAEPTSQLRRGPHDRSLVITAYDAIVRDRPVGLQPELILRFGDLPTSKPLRQWLAAIEGLDQVVVDPYGDWREPTRRAATVLRAEPVATAHALAGRLSRLRPGAATVAGSPFASGWLDAERGVREAVDGRLEALEELSEPGVWGALGRALRDGDSVFAASSMPVRDLEGFLRPGPEGVRFASNRGANGIDGLVSTAAGLAAGSGSRTWAVLGDLALFHDIGGLAAVRHAPELRLIVIDNSGGGIFHFLPQAAAMGEPEFEALLGTPTGRDPADAARLFDLSVAIPETPKELGDALAADARMIVVRTDRRRNLELHRELAEAAAAAVARS
ncbi:MAG TPA: 2-succinyl-5-enolpyruvyl-6-hydroxy-3-cyclohexene-1-carboxylic-acid synthase [Solirubrobacterales bacterium]|nr:2-succinyl-5-enolpyruvyl-6-hydroxy-3-cyclohexene-1-carboxylic-acid synthase [Solirubrobacterales bacterium]